MVEHSPKVLASEEKATTIACVMDTCAGCSSCDGHNILLGCTLEQVSTSETAVGFIKVRLIDAVLSVFSLLIGPSLTA